MLISNTNRTTSNIKAGQINLNTLGNSRIMNIKNKGLVCNSDGSTNNMSQYFSYCRETITSSIYNLYMFYYIWAFVNGFLVVNISLRCLNGIINSDG